MPSPRKPMPERRRDLAHLRQMRHQLGLGLVHGLDRRAGQFELPAGLQRNRAAAGDVVKPDDVAALHDRLPAEQKLHAFEQRADAARAFIRHGLMALERERRLLVLGADAEFGRRLHARFQPRHEFVARLQRRHIDLVTRHKKSGSCGDSTERARVAGKNADGTVRKDGRYRGYHRAGTPSRAAAVLMSPQEQPSRSSRPQSFMASASDSFEPTCFSIAAE